MNFSINHIFTSKIRSSFTPLRKWVVKKTFIDPKLLSLTRKFTNREILKWKKEDILLKSQKIATPKMILQDKLK